MATSPSRTGPRGSASNRHHRGRLTAACLGAAAAQVILAGTALANPPASWGLDRIDQRGLPYDGEYCPTGDGAGVVNVYVVGTGIFTGHDDFGGRAVPFYDFDPPNMGEDQDGRGTWLASIAGGTTYGVAKDVWLNSVRVTDTGSWSPSALELGLRYVGANGTPGVVLIDGYASGDPLVDTAVADLVNLGYVVVVGAGDADSDACAFSPARESSAMTVAASDVTDRAWAQSNFGSCVDLFAPGVGITGAGLGSPSAPHTGDGTAAAAAHVAGAAAIILGENPGMSQTTVRNMMLANSTPNHLSDVAGSPNRLLYVEPGPCPVDPCPTSGVATTKSFAVVGAGTGAAWEWSICSPTAGFPDVVGTYPGSTGTALDIANAFAGSINAAGCSSISASAAPNFFPPGSAILTINVDDAFELKVRTVGSPTWCTVTTFGACSFNPDIQEILLSGFDCQNNGVDDIVDILTGTSVDTNVNAIPDECEGLTSDAPLGIAVQALGDAIIGTTIEGYMTVSNIDSSGLNGVSIDLGQAQGWEGTFHGSMVAADLPTGTMFTDEVIGSVNGVPGQTIITTTIEDVGGRLEMTPEIPGFGTYRIEISDGSTLVASIPSQIGPAYRVASVEGGGGGYIVWTDDDNVIHCVPPPSSQVIPIEIVSTGQIVNGDRIRIICEGTAEVQWMSEIRRRGRTVGAGQVTEVIERMAINQFGQQHEATGAVQRGEGGRIVVENIGASCLDTSVDRTLAPGTPPAVTEIDIDLTPVALGTVNQMVVLRSRGGYNGKSDQDLGMASLLWTGAAVEVTADFSAIGTTDASVVVYYGGARVDEVVLSTDSALGTLTDLAGGTVAVDSVGKLSGAWPCFVKEFPDPIIFTPQASPFAGSAPLIGDEIRILAQNPTAAVDYLESMSIATEGIDGYTILAETFDVSDSCPANLDGSGDVGFADLTALLNAWGPCGVPCDADLDGSGDVGFADLTALLNAWGPCA